MPNSMTSSGSVSNGCPIVANEVSACPHAAGTTHRLQSCFGKALNALNLLISFTRERSKVRSLVRPPSSLRKPRVSDTTPNRALLRGFPATYFADFGLCRRSRFFVMIFGALSLHPKIPFPAAGL
jgi:hypothetical protein